MTAESRLEAIAYVDVSKTGLDALAAAVLTRWSVDGVKPDPALYGEEIVAAARDLYARRTQSDEEYRKKVTEPAPV